jgi:hypothetical protein
MKYPVFTCVTAQLVRSQALWMLLTLNADTTITIIIYLLIRKFFWQWADLELRALHLESETILFLFPSAHCSHHAAEPLADEATNAVTREGSPYL